MPSVTYMNQSAPFWDFVASLENQGSNHPFFSRERNDENGHGEGPPGPPPFGPWGWGHHWGGRGFPFRGPPPPDAPHEHDHDNEKGKDAEKEGDNENKNDNGEGSSSSSSSENEGCGRRRCWRKGRRCEGHGERRGEGRGEGRCGGRWGGHGWGPYGHHGGRGGFGPHHGPGPHAHHGPGRRGGWGGPWGRGPFNPWAFAASFLNPDNFTNKEEDKTEDLKPEADVFDTPTTYVIHISLPGAKKEDVGVNWDADKSELSVAGVIYRPGDEEFLKTLAMDERKVGPFERKIRLGTRANPAQIDVEGITAKLEDGILRVEVPKKLEEGFVDVRKVDIE